MEQATDDGRVISLAAAKRILDDAMVAAGQRALKGIDDGVALGRKYGRIEGAIIGFAAGVGIASIIAIGAMHVVR